MKKSKNNDSVLAKGETEIRWPIVAERNFEFSGQKELEPNESDEIIIDFLIDKQCEELLVYSYVANDAKPGTNLGWSVSTTCSLHCAEQTRVAEVMDKKQSSQSIPDKRQGQAKPRPETVDPPFSEHIQSQPKPRPEKPEKKP